MLVIHIVLHIIEYRIQNTDGKFEGIRKLDTELFNQWMIMMTEYHGIEQLRYDAKNNWFDLITLDLI